MDPELLARYALALASRARRFSHGLPELDSIDTEQLRAANEGLEAGRAIPEPPGPVSMCQRTAPLGAIRTETREIMGAEEEFLVADLRWTVEGSLVRLYRFDFKRYEWQAYDEELVVSDEATDLGRLNSGRAPLLDNHAKGWDHFTIEGTPTREAVIGVIEEAWLGDDAGKRVGDARVRFSRRPDLEDLRGEVRDRILVNTSVGYRKLEVEWIEAEDRADGGDVPLERATRWLGHEISIVPIGADDGAAVLQTAARSAATRSSSGGFNPFDTITRGLRARATSPAAPPVPTTTEEIKRMNKINVPAGFQARCDASTGAVELVPTEGARGGWFVVEGEAGSYTIRALEGEGGTPATGTPEDRFAEGATAERERAAGIRLRGKTLGIDENVIEEHVARGIGLDAATERFHRMAAEREASAGISGAQGNPGVEVGDDRKERALVEGMRIAMMYRANRGDESIAEEFRKNVADGGEAGRFAGMSWLRMAEFSLEHNGISVVRDGARMSNGQIANAALWCDSRTHGRLQEKAYSRSIAGGLSVADFPNIMADAVHKVLRRAYERYPRTFQAWTRQVNLKDFRPHTFTQMSDAPTLLPIGPGGEIEAGTMRDSGEAASLEEFARKLGIQRKTIVNDDLDALGRIPVGFALNAAMLETQMVYAVLTNNGLMGDGTALFHADHGNLGGAGAPDAAGKLAEIRRMFRKVVAQAAEAGDTGGKLNLLPRYLIIPSDLEDNVDNVLSDRVYPGSVSDEVAERLRRLFVPIVEPELDDTSTSEFYSAIDPNQTPIDTVVWGYLEGEEGLQSDTQVGFDVLGVQMRFYMTFFAKALDWRSMQKHPG